MSVSAGNVPHMPDDPNSAPAEVPAVDAPAARRGPLHDRHLASGAKLADFGGWKMPIEFPDGGVLKKHAAVREGGASPTSLAWAKLTCGGRALASV